MKKLTLFIICLMCISCNILNNKNIKHNKNINSIDVECYDTIRDEIVNRITINNYVMN